MCNRIPVFILLSLICITGVYAFDESNTSTIDSRALDPAAAEHTLLVTFRDRSINRITVGPRNSQYTPRGNYDSMTWAHRTATRIAADYGLEMIAEWRVTELGVHCVVYYVPADQLIKESENALTNDHRVENVQHMGIFKTLGAARGDPYYSLQHSIQSLHIEQLHQRSTGHGIRIAIIDTGIDLVHPDLDGQFLDDSNFVSDISPSFESDRHGTAVAGIIGAKTGNGAGIVGIASDAKMYAYKACWETAQDGMDAVCNSFTLALAINRAIRMDAQIINLSLTGPADPLLAALLKRAIERGIIVVAADDSTADNAPGFPASIPQVIAVRNSASISPGSELRSNVIAMPGTEVLTTMPQGTYDFLSGSSFSAASVSGLAALALQLQPDSTSTDIISALQHSGTGPSSTLLYQFENL